jgi:hypothetical protein
VELKARLVRRRDDIVELYSEEGAPGACYMHEAAR